MSNRLTFSLASLFLIFAFAFVAMPVMAADGGPTVTIGTISGNRAADTSATPPTTGITVEVTYSVPVTVTDVTVADLLHTVKDGDGEPIGTAGSEAGGVATVPAGRTGTHNKFKFTLPDITNETAREVVVWVPADGAAGLTPGLVAGPMNQASAPKTHTLPPLHVGKVEITAEKDTADTDTSDGQTYKLMFTFKKQTGAPTVVLDASRVTVMPSYVDAPVTIGADAQGTGDDAADYIYNATIVYPMGDSVPEITVGLEPSYVAASNVTTAMIPPAEAPDPVPPMAVITIEDYMLADDGEASFYIGVTFSDGDDVKVADLVMDMDMMFLDVKDSSDPAQTVELTEGLNQKAVNSYKARMTFTYDPRFITLPLVIKVNQKQVKTSNPDHSGMVGGDGTTPPAANAPAKPDAPMAETNATDDLKIDVSWTAPADNGSAITGYTVKKYMGTTDTVVKTFPADDPNTDAITGTSYMVGPVPATDRGMSFTFTVTAMNANGPSMESDRSALYTVPQASRTAPAAPAGLTATAGDAQVTLNWTVSPDTSITLYQYSDDGNAWADITGSDATTVTHIVAGLTNGTTYTFRLRAVNSVGDGAVSTADPVTPMASLTIPGPVTNLTATAGDARVTLNWTKPATGDIGSYEYSMNNGSTATAIAGSNARTVRHTVMGLTNGQTYTFVVRAINSAGNGDWSNAITATPVKTDPTVDNTKPTVTIAATPTIINCDTGSTLRFTFSETLATGAAVAVSEVSASTGWEIMASGGAIKVVPKKDGSEIGVTTVTVTVAADAVKDAAGNGNVAKSETFTVGPVLTIPEGGFIVVIRPEHSSSTHLRDTLYLGSLGVRGAPVTIRYWECMPDLTVFFGKSGAGLGGGALVVKQSPNHTGAAIGKGTVGISEIMWASDEGTIHGLTSNTRQAREQWIELHNTNNHPVTVTLFARLTDHALTTENDEIDRASNYEVGNTWVVKGQSGNSALGVDFVSMFRSKNANNYAHGDNDGKNAGKWHASTLVYRTRSSELALAGQLAPENLTFDFKGTPGRSNTISAANPPLRTDIKNSPIIFNEVANRRDQTLEWIELKNVSDSAKDLRNYEISIVTGVGTDTRLFHFNYGDNQVIMQPGELLLLVDTDPRYNDDHPVAVGYNVRGGNDQALAVNGDSPRYLVTDFAEGGLPDNGEFLLILRTSKGDEGYEDNKKKSNRVSDVVGYHPNLKAAGHPLYTNLWPFSVYGTARTRNKIEVETVHYRRVVNDPDQGDNAKPEQIALNNAGYTGVGYKRHAQKSVAHGGTPGYEDIRKGLVADIRATGRVTISEIMFDQGDGRYPQWIELYNSSPTQAVDLKAGDHGWRLVIENFDDGEIPVRRLTGTLNFRSSDVQTILPQQTVIVASTRARNSGSAYFDTAVVFPPTRVFSVWDDARAELDMKRSTDSILSTQGFYIELIDGKDKLSDSVGNLVDSPNRRVAATIEWPLSDVTGERTEDMERSSIIRRYREPKGGDSRDWVPYSDRDLMDLGIEAEGWVAAHETDFREVRQTWFGHPDDYGSPGITGGRVLPVRLSKFRPERLEDGTVAVRWITESELNNAGFNILRSESKTGEFTKLNTQLIAGKGTTSERNTYEFIDTSAKPNVVYYYQIQDVSFDGDVEALRITHLRGNVSAAGKLTTTWGELKALQ